MVSRVAQLVFCLVTGCATRRWRIGSRQRLKDFSSNLYVQADSGAHTASYTMSTMGPFPGVSRGRDMTLTTRPHLAPSLRMSRSYTSSPTKCLRVV
jgi:hypothetical protein